MFVSEIPIWSVCLAGALSFFSPCVLPLVPPYLCYMAGVSLQQFSGNTALKWDERLAVLKTAMLFTLGFTTVFVILGMGAWKIGALLRQYTDSLKQVAGILIILSGLNFLGVLRIDLLTREARFQGKYPSTSLFGAYVMGLAFAFGWTPCIGPVLGSILSLAAMHNTATEGALLLALYSAGLAVPFWISGLCLKSFMAVISSCRQHLWITEKILGSLLVLSGIVFLSGFLSKTALWLQYSFYDTIK